MVIVARLPCAGVTWPLWDRAASVILGVGSQSVSGGNVAPELVDATPSGNLLGNGTAIDSHNAARRCEPALRVRLARLPPCLGISALVMMLPPSCTIAAYRVQYGC